MAGSPPKVMSMHEVMDCVKNLEDMQMAHEIAINPEFRLQPFEPPADSLERRVKDMIHQAFWDLLRQQLDAQPPCYDHAIQLLSDVKEYFEHIFLSNNKKVLEHICEVLDASLIRQQAEQGCIDFPAYAKFVIDVMAKSCAPIRDQQVAQLRELGDVVDTFRGIMECLSVMRLDMANCLLDATRHEVIANSVEYEKKKFRQHLETYTLGFPATEAWLRRNLAATEQTPPEAAQAQNGAPPLTKHTITNAYLDLVEWDPAHPFPELLEMDAQRLQALQARAMRLCACVSTLAVAGGVAVFAQNPHLRRAFARDVAVLTEGWRTEQDVAEGVESVWLQLRETVARHRREQGQPDVDEATEQALRSQVLQVAQKESPVRSLMWKRTKIYLRLCLYSKNLPPPPPGFAEFQDELESLTVAFRQITSYNYAVFGDYYEETIARLRA